MICSDCELRGIRHGRDGLASNQDVSRSYSLGAIDDARAIRRVYARLKRGIDRGLVGTGGGVYRIAIVICESRHCINPRLVLGTWGAYRLPGCQGSYWDL